MSKSLKRVRAALAAAEIAAEVVELQAGTKTAEAAANAVGCGIDQIAKSIIFATDDGAGVVLFVTAGGRQVDPGLAGNLAGQTLAKADAALIRARTGFAIGGVSPVGHIHPTPSFIDKRLLDFDLVYAAAGTPHHLFAIDPRLLPGLTGGVVGEFTEI